MSEIESGKSTLPSRRQLLKTAPAALAGIAAQTAAAAPDPANPNIIIIISDQFRADCIGAAGKNPMNLTPNIDEMAGHGTIFTSAICAQPVCAPARASTFTSQYPSHHGVWKNAIPLAPGSTTLATTLRQSGYTANYIGKWHLGESDSRGPVKPDYRGGFLDLWQASNELEWTSHPYEGDLYDNQGEPIHFSNTYRTDFMTDLAQKFLHS